MSTRGSAAAARGSGRGTPDTLPPPTTNVSPSAPTHSPPPSHPPEVQPVEEPPASTGNESMRQLVAEMVRMRNHIQQLSDNQARLLSQQTTTGRQLPPPSPATARVRADELQGRLSTERQGEALGSVEERGSREEDLSPELGTQDRLQLPAELNRDGTYHVTLDQLLRFAQQAQRLRERDEVVQQGTGQQDNEQEESGEGGRRRVRRTNHG